MGVLGPPLECRDPPDRWPWILLSVGGGVGPCRSSGQGSTHKQGTWYFAAGPAGALTVDAAQVTVRADGTTRTVPTGGRPLERVAEALMAVPGDDWRGFGWASFELAHLIHGNREDTGSEDLFHIILPFVEVELAPDRTRIRASTAQHLKRAAWLLARPELPKGTTAGSAPTAGTVLIFLVLILRVYAPLLQVVGSAEQSRLAEAALRRVGEIRDLRPEPTPDQETATVDEPTVQLDDVTFGYDADRPVIQDLSLEVAPNTMTAIVGPSGVGKSTLLALVARFWDVDSGTVHLGGADVRDLTSQQLFNAITVVFQDVYLFQGTIRDNIAFGREGATDELIEAAARQAQAHDFTTALPQSYDTPVGENGATLSGGERQRISIARAIVKDAPIVLLDEATAALDPINERAVQQAFAELVRARTVIVVAHRLSTIRSADQIVVLDGGEAVERGRHEELLAANGRYAQLWAERERASRWRLATTSER